MSLASRMSRWILAAILFTAIVSAPRTAGADRFKRVVAFGDSLSDNGNLFALTGFPPAPFYWMGRSSNGPVWVEDLAQILDAPLEDYAFAGANTDDTNNQGPFPGIRTQVGDSMTGYISTHPVADNKALYVIWGGANDYLSGGQTNPYVTVGNLVGEIRQLAATGARNFLIPNLPDLGSLPATAGTPYSDPLNYLTAAHNAILSAALANLQDQFPGNDIDIRLFDVNTLVRGIMASPSDFSLTNVTQAYLFNPVGSPDEYLFWDPIHPTAHGHQILADSAAVLIHDQRRQK